tara:strand:+ start:163 stop:945 length:783 start_codon:yes stop_codon:yes gene_type:complete
MDLTPNNHPNNFNDFWEAVKTGKLEPSRQNLYAIEIPPPITLMKLVSRAGGDGADGVTQDYYRRNINLFSSSVTIPSRAVTIGQVNNHGMMRRFGTGQTSSQISMSFLSTKDNFVREWFEMWLNVIGSDSDNTVGFYDDYTTDARIYKWERGSNIVQSFNFKREEQDFMAKATLNQSTAVYQFYRLFPFNISTQTLDNEAGNLMKIDVQFYYERYRFDTVNVQTLKWKGPDGEIGWRGRGGLSQNEVEKLNAKDHAAYGT